MLFSTDVRDEINKWAKANNVEPNQIVAYESGTTPNKAKPGFTYEPITIPVDVPGMRFYKKVPLAPQGAVPDFSKLDPPHPQKSVDPKPKPKPAVETRPSVTFGRAHKDEPKPKPVPKPRTTFTRKGGKK